VRRNPFVCAREHVRFAAQPFDDMDVGTYRCLSGHDERRDIPMFSTVRATEPGMVWCLD
jgi:hypothetical protein